MSVSHRSPLQPKKHTKTFSGCWTCRVRKVKCGEEKPHCLQCRRKGTQCEGYGIRLQWVNHVDDDVDSPIFLSPRTKVTPDAHRPVLPYGRVDQILNTLDSLGSRRKAVNNKDVALFIECFGVFGERRETLLSSQPDARGFGTDSAVETPVVEDNADSSPLLEFPGEIPDSLSLELLSPYTLGGYQGFPFDQTEFDFFGDADGTSGDISHTSLVGDTGLQPPSPRYSESLTATSFISCPTPSFLSSNERFLMHHYSKRVLYIFCVIDHGKSPWKSIHLPRALQSIGELSVQGSASRIRNALTNTLLAISAFVLSNDNKSSLQTDEAINWRTAAEHYRCKAIGLLRDAVEHDFYHKSPPKYKDFLATTLSMITMNVISGDIETCGIHLDGAFRLITQAQKWKRKYSPKAQSLHRIYFYLRTIYESTAPRLGRASRRFSFSDKPSDPNPSKQEEDIFCQNLLHDQMLGYKSGLDLDLEAGITNCERIYGIPHSLLFLLSKVIGFLDKLHDAPDPTCTTLIPDHLVKECDELEKSIMGWPATVGLEESVKGIESPSSKIVYHHTLAFHSALIIYFAQHIPLVGHRFLQPYVTAVLESMEVIEALKIGAEILAAPLYWPAFIAGSEAFDKRLQDRFRLWYDHVQVYRIEALRTGIEVLTEIWEAGPLANRRTCYWRAVVERLDVRLMLS